MSTKYKRLSIQGHRGFPLHLPENVVVEILLRLPVKSLVRFRCVSKRWCSLISDPRFSKSQFRRASVRSQRLLISSRSGIRSLDCEAPFEDSSTPSVLVVPFQKRGRYVSIIGSCNGLVCVSLYSHRDYYIWNPSTGNYRKLPDPGISLPGRKYWHGFGYDPSTDDYKLLVANFRMPPSRESEGKVFSFKRNSWKRILRGLEDPGYTEDSAGILCNGSLHWYLQLCREPLSGQKIHGFDLAEEKFHEIPMPSVEYGPEYVCTQTLSNLGERLCLIFCMSTHFQIWGMMEYGVIESWAPMHRVGYFRVEPAGKDLNPLCLSRSGELVAMKHGIDLMRSNPDGEILEYVDDFSDCDSRVCYATMFVESLLSPYLCLT
ncbi:hypothetical protein F2P56_037129 [Juglans regia]|uniref:F-box domain-containing protein n=2 Tax=Juglans regia TaxID=51240 RepID=A0A833TL26_JUGRE|nr:F-box/kelch-repeat protein At3g06240-like [Juglans regia]KAF5441919.1 hypothetical protein F2P56_037129 [Juglans regia]